MQISPANYQVIQGTYVRICNSQFHRCNYDPKYKGTNDRIVKSEKWQFYLKLKSIAEYPEYTPAFKKKKKLNSKSLKLLWHKSELLLQVKWVYEELCRGQSLALVSKKNTVSKSYYIPEVTHLSEPSELLWELAFSMDFGKEAIIIQHRSYCAIEHLCGDSCRKNIPFQSVTKEEEVFL